MHEHTYKFLLKGKVATACGYDARVCQKSSAGAISLATRGNPHPPGILVISL